MTVQGTIVAPIGGFGNHIRWLMMVSMERPRIFDFIITKVYTEQRSWHNWLLYEWKYRRLLDRKINLIHNDDGKVDVLKLFVISDPELCYKSYLKFNSSLNNTPVKDFLASVERANRIHEELSQLDADKTLAINGDVLFQRSLDRDLYHQITGLFKIDDAYDEANQIHTLWYDLHKKSEQEFVRDISILYKDS